MTALLLFASLGLASPLPDVVVITLDTTRADAIGAYGESLPGLITQRTGVTPNLDALARDGVRFARFYAHAPTTLNSHASLFTGRDPHEHAVPRNGYPLPDGVSTLAERFEAEGYDTIAVVAAAALEAQMGLSRGFRVYDDTMSVQHGPMYQDTAEGVVARVEAAMATHTGDAPLFLWVHFYDPHGPYAAPGDAFGRFADPAYDGPYIDREVSVSLHRAIRAGTADPADVDQIAARYLGEVHYMDHHLGLMLDGLEEHLRDGLLVITADHGETLSERPRMAWSHGQGVDEGVTRIPLILKGPAVAAGAVVQTQLDMSGLASTIESLAGLEPSLSPEHSFAHLARPGPVYDVDGWPSRPTRVSFSEATRSRIEPVDAWNNAHLERGVRVSSVFVTANKTGTTVEAIGRATLPDPVDGTRSLLIDLLTAWDIAAPPHRDPVMSDETLDALRALGYIGGPSEDPGDDPASTPP